MFVPEVNNAAVASLVVEKCEGTVPLPTWWPKCPGTKDLQSLTYTQFYLKPQKDKVDMTNVVLTRWVWPEQVKHHSVVNNRRGIASVKKAVALDAIKGGPIDQREARNNMLAAKAAQASVLHLLK